MVLLRIISKAPAIGYQLGKEGYLMWLEIYFVIEQIKKNGYIS